MANYQRCLIRVYPNNGTIDLDDFIRKVEQLKVENNIYETIDIFYPENINFAEIRFTAKRYPTMLAKIFNLEDYDLWIINAGEGGRSDAIRFETRNRDLFWGFHEKAIYSFDEVRLFGDQEKIKANIKDIFGFGIRDTTKHEIENGIKIYLDCLYTANNFFYSHVEGEINIDLVDNEVKGDLRNETGEFWDMLFHVDAIKFKEEFYKVVQGQSTGVRGFAYLDKMEFYDKKRLVNQIEWSVNGGMDYWKHTSADGFWNCVNSKFYSYLLMKN